jgi:hypothetical protein
MLSLLLKPPLATLNNTFFFKDAPWFGGKHDGYSLLLFQDYTNVRPKIFTISNNVCCEHAIELQCMLIFGHLEVVMEVQIFESTLLQVDNNNESKVLTNNNLLALLHDWRNCVLQLGNEKQCR